MSRTQRTVLIAIAVIAAVVIVGVVVVALMGGGEGDPSASVAASAPAAASASEAPSEEPSAEESAEAEGGIGPEDLAILEEIEEQVQAIRGLPDPDIGPPDIISRAQLGVELQEIFDEEYPPEERERDNRALVAMGLLEPGQDVVELQLDLLGEGVAGFYDHLEERMVVVSEAGLDAAAKVTYAHEYTHALQYAAFDVMDVGEAVEDEDDAAIAWTSLIEGDAQLTMIAWLAANLTQEEQLELAQTPLPDTSDMPYWMVAQLEFPYVYGQFFVTELAGGSLFEPDFTAVDAAFEDRRPVSTEQVIDLNAYLAGEAPIPVTTPDLAGALGAGWEEVDSTPLGQGLIQITLEHFGVASADAGLAADGWGGDRIVIASGPDDAFALVWILAWDEAADATEFASAYEVVVGALPFPASVRILPDGTVLVVHGSTQELHDAAFGTVECQGC